MFDEANAHRTGALPPCSFRRASIRGIVPVCGRQWVSLLVVFTYQSRGAFAPLESFVAWKMNLLNEILLRKEGVRNKYSSFSKFRVENVVREIEQ